MSGEIVEKFKAAGFHEIDVHEAPDGQLLFDLHGDTEEQLFEELELKLKEHRVSQSPRETEDSPLYLKDETDEAKFWLRACLRTRKYETDRALMLYLSYLDFRVNYGIGDEKDPDHQATIDLVSTNFTRCCGNKDKCGRYILSFDAGQYQPSRWSPRIAARAIHHVVVNAIAKHPELPIRGLVTIGDFAGWGYSNFDAETEKLTMKLLTACLPVRLGTIYMTNSPWILRIFLRIVKVFLKKKMQERMRVVSNIELLDDIAEDQLDVEFGGQYVRDLSCLDAVLSEPKAVAPLQSDEPHEQDEK
eukprot:m.112489 g.112489  ORF g.112489 m.112489 type:complete len:303 (+) comp15328_c0_seq2:305-1213(+)